jgi:hypothetical protein
MNTPSLLFLLGRGLESIEEGADEKRDYRRRGRGGQNLRSGRWRSFFAIHVDPETRKVVGIEPELTVDETYETGPTEDGLMRGYPLGEGGERVWRNSRVTVKERIDKVSWYAPIKELSCRSSMAVRRRLRFEACGQVRCVSLNRVR